MKVVEEVEAVTPETGALNPEPCLVVLSAPQKARLRPPKPPRPPIILPT